MKITNPERKQPGAERQRIPAGKLKALAAEFTPKHARRWNAAEFLRQLRAK